MAMFTLSRQDLRGEEMARAFASALPRILRLLETHTRPLVGRVGPTGAVSVLLGERRGGIRRNR
jgi:hypothetical protein